MSPEIHQLLRALANLAGHTARALADGILTAEELIRIGAGDLPTLITAIVDLATPDDIDRAKVVVREGRGLVARKRRAAARLRRKRERGLRVVSG